MAERTAASFVESWKQLDGQFDEVARLRELRTLVAQGAVSQDVYDQLHRYTLEKQATGRTKKQLDRKRAQNKKLPSQNRVHGRPNGNHNGLQRQGSRGTMSGAGRKPGPDLPSRPTSKAIKGRTLARPPSLLRAFKPRAAAPAPDIVVADFDGEADWGTKPVMEGFLYKRAITSGRNWKKRYVRLFYDRLEYYANKGDTTPRGEIKITKDLYVADSILRRIKNSRAHGFMVSDFAQTYYLAASSAESKVYWMHTVRRVIQRLKDQDDATDEPVLLDRPQRSKSETERDMSARLKSYRKSQNATPSVSALAARAGLHDSAKRRSSKRESSKRDSSKRDSSKRGSSKRGGEATLEPHESRASTGELSLSDREYEVPLHADPSDELSSSYVADEDDDDEEDDVSDDDDRDRVRAISFTPKNRRTLDSAGGAMSGRFMSQRDEKARSMASAAMAAHASARMSAKQNLGLDVVSYAEQEELREEAAAADAARFMADVQNEAALAEVDVVLETKRGLRRELRAASKSGADDADMDAVRAEYEATRRRLAELEGVMARTAAERAEAEDNAQRSRDKIARAEAANAVVLELAKVDEAILRAEELAEAAEAARARAEAAALTVRREAMQEAQDRTEELELAQAQVDEASRLEEEREEQERRILARLEATAAEKIGERQRKKIEEVAEKAALARAEAEEQRFQAELEATRLASERLDAAQKAAAVTRALRETQAIIDKSRARSGLQEFGFANPKKEAAAAPAGKTRGAGAPAPKPKAAAANAAAAAAAAPAQGASAAASKRRASLFDKLRPRRSLENKKKGANKKKPQQQQQAPTPKPAAAPAAAPPASRAEPEEAAGAFQSFFRQFTQAAMDGIEYVTGLQLTGDADTGSVPRDHDRASTALTYDDDDDEDDEEEEEDSDLDDFDEQLRAVGEAERIKAASAWIEFEIKRLLEVIREIGSEDEYGRSVTTFRELLEVYEDISDTLVGILLRAKRAGKVFYDGDMLFEIEHDDVEIVALD